MIRRYGLNDGDCQTLTDSRKNADSSKRFLSFLETQVKINEDTHIIQLVNFIMSINVKPQISQKLIINLLFSGDSRRKKMYSLVVKLVSTISKEISLYK